MGKIVLLAVAAAWAAVLLPPLLRSRMENRPGSSVTDFRRQLSTLQRAVPTRSMTPMRSMARPLAPSPLQRPAAAGRPGQLQRTSLDRTSGLDRASLDRAYERYGYDREGRGDRGFERPDRAERYERSHGEVGYSSELRGRYQREHRLDREATAPQAAHRSTHVRRVSQREVVRRRRANVLFVLVMANALTLFLSATTKSSAMVYAFAFAFVSLCGYCYKLAQLRQYEQSPGADAHWYHAA